MTNKNCIERLSAACFWDTNRDEFDMEQYPAFIIARVLEVGNINDWKALVAYYGIKRIAKECMTLRHMSSQDLAFVSTMSGTRREEYRCYHSKP